MSLSPTELASILLALADRMLPAATAARPADDRLGLCLGQIRRHLDRSTGQVDLSESRRLAAECWAEALNDPNVPDEVARAAHQTFWCVDFLYHPHQHALNGVVRSAAKQLGWPTVAELISEVVQEPVACDVLVALLEDFTPLAVAIDAAVALRR